MRALASNTVQDRTEASTPAGVRPFMNEEVVSEALARAGLAGPPAAALVLERGWPMPKVPLMLRFRDTRPSSDLPRWWTLHVIGDQRLPYPLRRGLRLQRAKHVKELGSVVQSFPEDLLLQDVEKALDPNTALPHIANALQLDTAGLEILSADVLTYKPARRLTIRYRLRRSTGDITTLFGKCYAPGADSDVLEVSEALARARIEESPRTLCLPEIVGHVEPWNMLLWESLIGASVHDALAVEGADDAVEVAGRCLGDLHGSFVDWARVHDRSRETATLRSWIGAVATADITLGEHLFRLFQRLVNWEPVRGPLVPSHRDFYDKQILINSQKGGLLDLETASLAEPELDVANFMAHLELRVLQGHQVTVDRVANRFVEGYGNPGTRLSRDRLCWYRAGTLLRLACVYYFRFDSKKLSNDLRVLARHAIAEDAPKMRI